MYYGAEGNTPKEKINSLRKDLAEKQVVSNHITTYGENARIVDKKYISSQKYRSLFRGLTDSAEVDDKICKESRKILNERDGSRYETLVLLDKNTGKIIGTVDNAIEYDKINYNEDVKKLIQKAHDNNQKIIAIHNHPDGYPPTADDCESAGIRGYDFGIALGHNGNVYLYSPSHNGWMENDCNRFHQAIALQVQYKEKDSEKISVWIDMMNENGFSVKRLE